MNHTHPHQNRTRATGVHPMVNPHFQCGMRPANSQSPKANTCFLRNEPNLPYRWRLAGIPDPALRKTNPIYRSARLLPPNDTPEYAKRTQFAPPASGHPCHSRESGNLRTTNCQLKRAKHLLRRSGAKTKTQFRKANCQKPTANSQKTQNEPNLPFPQCPAAPYFSETNPIYTATDLWKTKKYETNPISSRRLSPKNETNPISARPKTKIYKTNPIPAPVVIPSVGLRSEAQRPKAEGSTQSPSPKAIPHKQTTSTPRLMRNEPNSPPHAVEAADKYKLKMWIGHYVREVYIVKSHNID